MNKIRVIALREYRAMVRTKAFMITVFLMPLFLFGAVIARKALEGRVDVIDQRIVVIDHTGKMFEGLKAVADRRNEGVRNPQTGKQITPAYLLEELDATDFGDALRVELSQRVRRGELYCFVEIPEKLLDSRNTIQQGITSGDRMMLPKVKVYCENVARYEIIEWLEAIISQLVREKRLEKIGVSISDIGWAIAAVHVDRAGLFDKTHTGEIRQSSQTNRMLSFFYPMILVMIIFGTVMLTAQPMLQSVIEEKQQRIAEVLLGSASPFQIMLGKLLGNVGISLTIVVIYMSGGYALAHYFDCAQIITLRVIGWFLLYQLLAVLFFGALFIAVGAACTELKEAQSYMMPIMVLIIIPLMIWIQVLRDPTSDFSRAMSLFPPTAPMLMVLRIAATQAIPLWEPIVGSVLLLLCTLITVFLAGRIFRIGLLSQGKAPKLSELIRWIAKG